MAFWDTPENAGALKLFSIAFMAIAVALALHYYFFSHAKQDESNQEDEVEPDPPRNFTPAQLARFCGEKAPNASPFDTDGDKIYVSVKQVVYDVTEAADFYGVGGAYHLFAGHDCSKCFALFSLDPEELDDMDLSKLTASQRDKLDDWIFQFQYSRRYPVVGRLVFPPECKEMTVEEIAEVKGLGDAPEGRASPPLYVALKGKVFDVSFGGFEMYKEGGSYHLFAGKDASRALAKMSFDPTDVNSRDLSVLTEQEQQVLDDWVDKFENKKLYPVVGTLKD